MRDFESRLAFYRSHHQNALNRATHAVGIPLIVFSVQVALAPVMVGWVSAAAFVTALAMGAWLTLDIVIGLFMAPIALVMLCLAFQFSMMMGTGALLGTAAALFVLGWVFQLVGHGIEGRRPAFMHSLGQLVIGPMFLAAEALEALGLKRRGG
jgi:uncharacterized membrane protein YGL010W